MSQRPNLGTKNVLLISGKRTCGKDTCTEIAKQYFESKRLKVSVVSFARILKELFCRDTGYDLDRMLNDYRYKEDHRYELTSYFIKMRKEKGVDFFCNHLMAHIEQTGYNLYIVSDLRLKSDFEAFKKSPYNKFIIRVNSTDESKKKRGWVAKECDNDFTEIDLDDCTEFNKIFNNDSSLQQLKTDVIIWIEDTMIPSIAAI